MDHASMARRHLEPPSNVVVQRSPTQSRATPAVQANKQLNQRNAAANPNVRPPILQKHEGNPPEDNEHEDHQVLRTDPEKCRRLRLHRSRRPTSPNTPRVMLRRAFVQSLMQLMRVHCLIGLKWLHSVHNVGRQVVGSDVNTQRRRSPRCVTYYVEAWGPGMLLNTEGCGAVQPHAEKHGANV